MVVESKPRAEPSRRATVESLVKTSDLTGPIVAWFCTNCGTVYRTKDDAERCTVKTRDRDRSKHCTEWTCEDCGEPAFSAYQWYCHGCLDKKRKARLELKLANSLSVVKAKDYPSDRPIIHDDDWHASLDEFLEHCEEEGLGVPARVWATEPEKFGLDADDILSGALENWSEGCDDFDMDLIHGEDEFRAAVKAFNEIQTAVIYCECNTAVDLTDG